MSRTRKGNKGPGYEYWHREANSEGKYYTCPGKFSKKSINRKNRRKNKCSQKTK